jgi:hypothetical protein
MVAEPGTVSQEELRKKVTPLTPAGLDPDEVLAGVALSLTPPEKRTLPIVPIGRVTYAWSEDDASATKLGLELLSRLAEGLLAGPAGLLQIGFAVKDVVCFLIDVTRHSVQLTDPLQIKLLMMLHDAKSGQTARELRDRLGPTPPDLKEIEAALHALADAETRGRPKALVRADHMTWKCLL